MTLYKMVLATFGVLSIFDVLDYAFLHYNYKYDWLRQTLEEIVDTSYYNKSNLHPYDFDSSRKKLLCQTLRRNQVCYPPHFRFCLHGIVRKGYKAHKYKGKVVGL